MVHLEVGAWFAQDSLKGEIIVQLYNMSAMSLRHSVRLSNFQIQGVPKKGE